MMNLPPIYIEFEGVAPLREWEPVMALLVGRFAPYNPRGFNEFELAARFLEVVADAADPGCPAAPAATAEGKAAELVFLKVSPPGDWSTELRGETGVISALRSAAKKGKAALCAPVIIMVRKWLYAVLRDVRTELDVRAELARGN